ncbi:MAG: DUF4384 domain-containing protein [Candidatus Sumerlaeota bacterium]|nr:DUF4384 domain-containing protein [Candidatus Sumerlaeota bacterium]
MKALWSRIQVLAFILALAAVCAPSLNAKQEEKVGETKESSKEKASKDEKSKEGAQRPESEERNWDRGGERESLGVVPREIVPRPIVPLPGHYFSVRVYPNRSSYYIDDRVRVYFTASDDAYVYIFNTDAAGVTRQIYPNYWDRDNSIRGGHLYSIPDPDYALVATGPAGPESLHIQAYRKRWDELRPWDRFEKSDPYPKREISPESMRDRIKSQAEESDRREHEHEESDRRGRSPESLRIQPVPPPYPSNFAEDWARFTTMARYTHYPEPPVPPYHPPTPPYYPPRPPEYLPTPPVPPAHEEWTGILRIETSPSSCDVYLNGVYSGRSPGTFAAPVGTCEVTIYHPDYGSYVTNVRVRPYETETLNIRMQR